MLLVRQKGGKVWQEPPTQNYGLERELQDLLLGSPALIPGVDADRAVIADEVALAGGAADLVVVDADGVITIVECKLEANPEMRRTVVGQILAYAAALWQLNYEQFEAVMARRGVQLSSLASDAQVAEASEAGPALVRQLISRTLAAGEFRLVVAVDHITGELRSIVEWLNTHTSPKVAVLALEIGHAEFGGVELVVSDVYGEESAATKRAASAGPSHKWTEEELRAEMGRLDPTVAASLIKLFEHTRDHGRRDSWYWGDGKTPSVTPWMASPGGNTQPWSIYVGDPGTRPLSINFDWIYRRGRGFSDEAVERFGRRLSALPGLATLVVDARSKRWAKRPGIPAEVLNDPLAIDVVIAALDDLYAEPGNPDPGEPSAP